MGGLSLMHWLVIVVILMLFFGPTKIKDLGTSMGRAIRGFKEGLNEIEVEAKELPPTNQSESPGQQRTQQNVASEKDKSENKS